MREFLHVAKDPFPADPLEKVKITVKNGKVFQMWRSVGHPHDRWEIRLARTLFSVTKFEHKDSE
jgi:hypothetical protein